MNIFHLIVDEYSFHSNITDNQLSKLKKQMKIDNQTPCSFFLHENEGRSIKAG